MKIAYTGPVHDFEKDGMIHPRALVQGDLYAGDRVRIHAFASIGTKPFIFRLVDGRRVPSAGRFAVELHDDVEIFPRANIDAGSERRTRILRGAKIDHYAHIGHDAEIGEDSVVTGGVIICGFVRIGARCTIGANAVIKNRVSIGDDCMIGAGAVVTQDVPDNTVVMGNPAHHNYRRNWAGKPWEDPDW
jgi:UDP-3-O-[3-hydroxymyristoyl] glucosamine N-acyltransferase